MNRLAVAILVNDRRFILAIQWPTKATVNLLSRRKVRQVRWAIRDKLASLAAALIPLPSVLAVA